MQSEVQSASRKGASGGREQSQSRLCIEDSSGSLGGGCEGRVYTWLGQREKRSKLFP